MTVSTWPPYMTPKQASKYTQYSPQTLRNYELAGDLTAIGKGRGKRYERRELDRFMHQRRNG